MSRRSMAGLISGVALFALLTLIIYRAAGIQLGWLGGAGGSGSGEPIHTVTKDEAEKIFRDLRASSQAILFSCEMQVHTEILKQQMGESDASKVGDAKVQCLRQGQAAILPSLEKAKNVVSASASATGYLKDWYSAWLAQLQNPPTDGSEAADTAVSTLDEKLNKAVTEASW